MCGIVGIVSQKPVTDRLVQGLKGLEYRGYDSAGVATIVAGDIQLRRAKGKLQALQELIANSPIKGNIGIGHTRWATHGVPSEDNAHPHTSDSVAVVHNGIIENFADIKAELSQKGHIFKSQTDTEVIVHLLTDYLDQGHTPLKALQETLDCLKGAFALAIVFKEYDNLMMVARRGSPLVIGYGEDEMTIGSDALVLAPWTQQMTYLEDGDYAVISLTGAEIYDEHHNRVERPVRQSTLTAGAVGKGEYRHFMLKEIYEQPTTIGNTLAQLIDRDRGAVDVADVSVPWASLSRLTIVACGTSYYAGMIAKYWFEQYAKLPVDVDIASEFRYRQPPLTPGGMSLFISQSGETIDTLTGLSLSAEQGQDTLAIVNVAESSMARQANHVLYTQAGPEIGVASTKAFTAQLTVLACLAIQAGRVRGHLTEAQEKEMVQALVELPGHVLSVLHQDGQIQTLANRLKDARDVLFLGRGTSYPVALEGALKLKEISYIHAEGYPAGELKHGPIALIDAQMPVVVVAPEDKWLEKTISNMQEVMARGGQIICMTDKKGADMVTKGTSNIDILHLPYVNPFVAPILYTVPLQLLSYHTALMRGTDVDQPRNLAKSVTVE
jgi:glucosamine--fructose-6-phosphate aminotransferase (isomerizing)